MTLKKNLWDFITYSYYWEWLTVLSGFVFNAKFWIPFKKNIIHNFNLKEATYDPGRFGIISWSLAWKRPPLTAMLGLGLFYLAHLPLCSCAPHWPPNGCSIVSISVSVGAFPQLWFICSGRLVQSSPGSWVRSGSDHVPTTNKPL